MTSEPQFAAIVGEYRRDMGSRLDEIADLRRQAGALGPAVQAEVHELLEVVTSSVRRSAEVSGVLEQWLHSQAVELSGVERSDAELSSVEMTSGETRAGRLQG